MSRSIDVMDDELVRNEFGSAPENNNNKQICIAPQGRNFGGAGARQCVSEQRKKKSQGEEECL